MFILPLGFITLFEKRINGISSHVPSYIIYFISTRDIALEPIEYTGTGSRR